MVVHNSAIDPHKSDHGYYECLSCGTRSASGDRKETCGGCGGELRNIAIARE